MGLQTQIEGAGGEAYGTIWIPVSRLRKLFAHEGWQLINERQECHRQQNRHEILLAVWVF